MLGGLQPPNITQNDSPIYFTSMYTDGDQMSRVGSGQKSIGDGDQGIADNVGQKYRRRRLKNRQRRWLQKKNKGNEPKTIT
jgi:hypothetical protein